MKIDRITMKYKIPSVVHGVQMYWDFSTQNLNSAIALPGAQTVKYSNVNTSNMNILIF